MQKKHDERTLKMMESYMDLHAKGARVIEIAKKFHLSPKTIYSVLDEIAEQNGVTRDSLLYCPKEGGWTVSKTSTPLAAVDLTGFHESFDATMREITRMKAEMDTMIAEQMKMMEVL